MFRHLMTSVWKISTWIGLVFLLLNRLPKDGTPVSKNVGGDTTN